MSLVDQKVDALYGYFIEMGVPADSEFLNTLSAATGAEDSHQVAKRMQAVLDILDGTRLAEDNTVTENRSIDQVVDDMEKSFGDAHRDLQTFVLSLKQSGMDFQNAEAQVKALENVILNLQKSLQAAG